MATFTGQVTLGSPGLQHTYDDTAVYSQPLSGLPPETLQPVEWRQAFLDRAIAKNLNDPTTTGDDECAFDIAKVGADNATSVFDTGTCPGPPTQHPATKIGRASAFYARLAQIRSVRYLSHFLIPTLDKYETGWDVVPTTQWFNFHGMEAYLNQWLLDNTDGGVLVDFSADITLDSDNTMDLQDDGGLVTMNYPVNWYLTMAEFEADNGDRWGPERPAMPFGPDLATLYSTDSTPADEGRLFIWGEDGPESRIAMDTFLGTDDGSTVMPWIPIDSTIQAAAYAAEEAADGIPVLAAWAIPQEVLSEDRPSWAHDDWPPNEGTDDEENAQDNTWILSRQRGVYVGLRLNFTYQIGSVYVRQYPRDDGNELSAAPRLYPPTKATRLVGGYQ